MNTKTTPAPKEVPPACLHCGGTGEIYSYGTTPGGSRIREVDDCPFCAASGAPQEAPGDAPSDKLDAARYRWLRDKAQDHDWESVRFETPITIDALIDAAMKGPQ